MNNNGWAIACSAQWGMVNQRQRGTKQMSFSNTATLWKTSQIARAKQTIALYASHLETLELTADETAWLTRQIEAQKAFIQNIREMPLTSI
jgi:hypothetical protein